MRSPETYLTSMVHFARLDRPEIGRRPFDLPIILSALSLLARLRRGMDPGVEAWHPIASGHRPWRSGMVGFIIAAHIAQRTC